MKPATNRSLYRIRSHFGLGFIILAALFMAMWTLGAWDPAETVFILVGVWSIAGIGMGLVYLDTMNIFFEDPDQPDGIEIEEMASSSVIVESLASTMFVPLVASLISLAFASGQSFSTIPYGISWILVVVLAFASLAYLKRAMPAGGNTISSSV